MRYVGNMSILITSQDKLKVLIQKQQKIMAAKKVNSALAKPLTVSAELAEIVGKGPMPRTEVVKNLWVYIKKHDLQDAKNRRMVNADDKLLKIFNGKKQVSMFDMTKLVSAHLK